MSPDSERRLIRLDAVRADGWFERLGEGSPKFAQLCDVVGERFVAFAVIAGVRITALTVDRRSPDATLVDFVVGEDEEEQRLALGEFRRRLAAALVTDDPLAETLPEEPRAEDIQAFIGFRYLLLAPIFGIGLDSLHVGGGEPPRIVVDLDGDIEEVYLDDLRDTIHARIRAEVDRYRPQSPFAIDLNVIPEAQAAVAGQDWERAVQLLGAWPGPLSLLLRTAEGQQLATDVRSTLARSLGLLGTAYAKLGRHEWADEVMRLGIQWGQEGPAAGELFGRLGQAHLERGRHGEAIGLLRRALALGAPQRDILPSLAESYAARGRWVAAAVCAEEAIATGASRDAVAGVLAEAHAKLGAAWETFRARVPVPESVAPTVVPPADRDR